MNEISEIRFQLFLFYMQSIFMLEKESFLVLATQNTELALN